MSELPPPDHPLRAAVLEAARAMGRGLSRGRSGNVGARVEGGLLVTPSNRPYATMRQEDLVFVRMDGHVPAGQGRPSSEWRIHRDVLAARADVAAVVHAHPPFATALACLRREIPPFHYMVAVAGGPTIRCAPYALFGTDALAQGVLEALEGRHACLMANHGLVALGASPEAALELAHEVEGLCEQYWRACLAGEPVLLSEAEMQAVQSRFRDYRAPEAETPRH